MEQSGVQEIQRSLGRIEGIQQEQLKAQHKIFELIDSLRADFAAHQSEDRSHFQAIEIKANNLEAMSVERGEAIKTMKTNVETINDYVQNIKGAWWMLGILFALAGGFGALVTWFITVWRAKHGHGPLN